MCRSSPCTRRRAWSGRSWRCRTSWRQVFPGRKISGSWLTDPSALPVPLRGDAADLPGLDLPAPGADRKVIEAALTAHDEALDDRRLVEERRLFYVALTRAERVLLVSGHRWGATGDRPRQPSVFLQEVRDEVAATGVGRVEHWAEEPEFGTHNPATAEPVTAEWPVDPLGARAAAVHAGAELVRAALREQAARAAAGRPGADAGSRDRPATTTTRPTAGDPADPEGWAADVDVLLAERAAARERPVVALPAQLSVSRLVELAADPGGARRAPAPPAAAAPEPARPPRHGVPRLARAAVRRRPAARRRRAARRRGRGRRVGRAARGAAGGVPGVAVGGARAVRGRGAVRDRDRRDRRARSDGRGVRRARTAAGRSSTGRPARCPTRPAGRR